MTEPKHSPGPWKAAGPFAVLDAERNTLVKCAGPDKAANQMLIAAAPELLTTLSALLSVCEAQDGDDAADEVDYFAARDDARRAIAKAKGETR